MQIRFDVLWTKNLGTLYKENSIDTIGKDAFIDLDLKEVHSIIARFEVGGNTYDDMVQIIDVEKRQIRIPFKADVIKQGANKLELIATMKNGDVRPSQTYIYEIGESLENPNNIEAETNYPILISLLQEVGGKLEAIDDAVSKANNAVDKIDVAIDKCKDEISKGLDDIFVKYKEDTDKTLEDKFEAYVSSASENIDNLVEAKTSQVNSKIEEVNELIDSVEASESNREERHNAKIEELNSYSNEVNTLKQNISTNAKDIEDLKADVESNTHRINQISDTVDSHEDRIKTNEKYTRTHELLLNSLFEEDASESITLSNQEGTVISLPQSVNGVIEIKELQGNTMVNYCVGGSKELTLNNEIDVEGTNITLTDTIDNGLIDVMCEGNTLVNLMPNIDFISPNANSGSELNYFSKTFPLLQNNKTYTLLFDNICFTEFYLTNLGIGWIDVTNKNMAIFTINTGSFNSSSVRHLMFKTTRVLTDAELNNLEFVLLEGDYTNKPIPQYFEGMKSVGQDDKNGHNIEVVVQNKNLFNEDLYTFEDNKFIDDTGKHSPLQNYMAMNEFMKITPNETYASKNINHIAQYDESKEFIGRVPTWNNPVFTTDSKCKYIRLQLETLDNLDEIQLELGSVQTSYIKGKSNKKTIPLSEPLRGLPNGVKDRFVKQGSKWYAERNCKSKILNGSENGWYIWQDNGETISFAISNLNNDEKTNGSGAINNSLCDLFIEETTIVADTEWHMTHNHSSVCWWALNIFKSKLSTQDIKGFKKWLSTNPTTIIYQLATPIYEEITDSTLITYLDATHISNNSTIPCNMQVKNAGYNTIIKPSTQYVVAFDTNKTGEVGINLGGAKVTTSNNVATVTTPATLEDSELRLYGKGVNASKIRLLEGNKTDYIPSYFEGMQSCFEDKLQDDGTYKMEILSNNRNLFTNENYLPTLDLLVETPNKNTVILKGRRESDYVQLVIPIKGLKPDIDYVVTSDVNAISGIPFIALFDVNSKNDALVYKTETSNKATFKLKQGHDTIRLRLYANHSGGNINGHVEYKNIQLRELNSSTIYEETKSNKIQFSSIEPLRGDGNAKDKFVFKENDKLYIERNCGEVVLDGSENWKFYNKTEGHTAIKLTDNTLNMKKFGESEPTFKCDKFKATACSVLSLKNYSFITIDNNNIILRIEDRRLSNTDLEGFKLWLQNNQTKVVYELAEPIYEEVPFELQKIILECYKDGTLFFDTNIPPTSTVTYSASIPVVSRLNDLGTMSTNLVSTTWDMDYRLFELEWTLYECMAMTVDVDKIFNIRRNDTMALSRFEQAKIMILGGAYNDATLRKQLATYLSRGIINQEEHDELMSMMDARLLVEGN